MRNFQSPTFISSPSEVLLGQHVIQYDAELIPCRVARALQFTHNPKGKSSFAPDPSSASLILFTSVSDFARKTAS